uniref:HDC07406 n=1 Tax=Drosophila melanogaster TaxID=7227 RepID=Q6IG26_DROME|nr:TPA_inf: HDC07406 [Drosophila melanogaster]
MVGSHLRRAPTKFMGLGCGFDFGQGALTLNLVHARRRMANVNFERLCRLGPTRMYRPSGAKSGRMMAHEHGQG